MNVSQLIEELKAMPQDMPVLFHDGDRTCEVVEVRDAQGEIILYHNESEPVSIGANCVVRMDGNLLERYISFGQYDETTDCDEYGIPDEAIFFYAFEGEEQLKHEMMVDFTVVAYTPIYDPEDVRP